MCGNKKHFIDTYNEYGRNPSQFVLSNILEGTPLMWPSSVDYAEWRHNMADGLGVPAPSVIVVGSARLGYSLNPKQAFRDFGENSDIDVAIVDQNVFEETWREINYITNKGDMSESDEIFYRKLISRKQILMRSKVLSKMSYGERWLKQRGKSIESLGERFYGNNITFKIYRDHESILNYHISNVRQVFTDCLELSEKEQNQLSNNPKYKAYVDSFGFEIESITLSQIKKAEDFNTLNIQPDYQRKFVWSEKAQISLIETILLGFPVPEVYLAYSTNAQGEEKIDVVDGQQRITSIIKFYSDNLILDKDSLEHERIKKEYGNKKFSDLSEEQCVTFWKYRLPVRRLSNIDEDVIREVFARVNRVNMTLEPQELRNALYPGEFLDFLKDCASLPFGDVTGLFSGARRKRGGDIEFFAEVFLACIFGISNKKNSLDENYEEVSNNFFKYEDSSKRFLNLIHYIETGLTWKRTRWSNIVDMYTLINVLWDMELDSQVSDYSNWLMAFQECVNLARKHDLDRQSIEAQALEIMNRFDIAEEFKDQLLEFSIKYESGIRNSSDIGARRKRSTALSSWLSLWVLS